MNSFTYFTPQANITVIKILHNTPQTPAELYDRFVIGNAFQVIE